MTGRSRGGSVSHAHVDLPPVLRTDLTGTDLTRRAAKVASTVARHGESARLNPAWLRGTASLSDAIRALEAMRAEGFAPADADRALVVLTDVVVGAETALAQSGLEGDGARP